MKNNLIKLKCRANSFGGSWKTRGHRFITVSGEYNQIELVNYLQFRCMYKHETLRL